MKENHNAIQEVLDVLDYFYLDVEEDGGVNSSCPGPDAYHAELG